MMLKNGGTMIFSSYEFVFLFLPITLIIYFSLSKMKNTKYQHIFLVLASLYFYGYFNCSYLILIISSIVLNYLIAIGMVKHNSNNKIIKKLLFVVGIIFNVGLLGFFKYYDFFVSNLNFVLKTDFTLLHIMLPLGISFFTFQQLSFIVSIYKEEEDVPDFLTYTLFVTFFPQLIAGPIVLFSEMRPQFEDETRRKFNRDNFIYGFNMFVFGMSKKLIIADTISKIVDAGFAMNELSFELSWLIIISYSIQIYFDFSGYNDMALGLGKMFNFELTNNFDSPYKSQTISEFWRRWHITLGRALTTYVYIPLGGNRKGLFRTCFNLFVVFLISGIWHGANWTFIVWGILNGIIIVAERLLGLNRYKSKSKFEKNIRIIVTFIIVNFLWVFFRSESLDSALCMVQSMLNPFNSDILQILSINKFHLLYGILVFCVSIYLMFFKDNIQKTCASIIQKNKSYLYVAILFVLCMICMNRVSPFIYFNF